jgi:hypothetical protein
MEIGFEQKKNPRRSFCVCAKVVERRNMKRMIASDAMIMVLLTPWLRHLRLLGTMILWL